mgnify:CR=1 FL=1
MRCKMLLFNVAISSFSAATTKSGNKKGNSTSSKMASAETCGKSSESSEDVRSTQASSDKDSSSPLLIKAAFAVISEDMIR